VQTCTYGAGDAMIRTRVTDATASSLRPHLLRWRQRDLALEHELGAPVHHVVHRPDGRPLLGKIKTAWSGILEDVALGNDVLCHVRFNSDWHFIDTGLQPANGPLRAAAQTIRSLIFFSFWPRSIAESFTGAILPDVFAGWA
jgi:hypothetical protein